LFEHIEDAVKAREAASKDFGFVV
ncbi:TPA: HNH endonuclease, partial [Neisseria gonorrhoeae]